MTEQPRLFTLQRDTDITGISGTGTIAHGVQWPDGAVTIRWTGDRPSTVQWTGIDDVIAINGHGGHTRVIWDDAPGATGDELPRLHAIAANCCGIKITNFDIPSRAPIKIAITATLLGWTLSRDGAWTCVDHTTEPNA
ncbi:hypothetical protein [Kitasatospora sp. NPDC058478]|uniref:hypothetical protein n=1 Tax=unclassified Kitasatospora TaxID=2633591 RepID=UPI0036466A8E